MGKEYADARRHTAKSPVKVGDKVLVKNTRIGKLSLNYDPKPSEVLRKEGGEMTVRRKEGVCNICEKVPDKTSKLS